MSITPSITKSVVRNISASLDGDAKAIFPGASGDYISTPDSAVARITGDIEISTTFSASSYPATFRVLTSKWGGTEFAYRLLLTNGNFPQFRWSEDGSAQTTKTSTVGYPTAVNTVGKLSATLDVSTGEVKFFVDGVLLDTAAGSGATSICDCTAGIELGSDSGGTSNIFTGNIFSAQVFNGIGGTLAVDFNADDYIAGDNLTSQETGEVYTLNGNVTIQRA